jgi:hypothetical protein
MMHPCMIDSSPLNQDTRQLAKSPLMKNSFFQSLGITLIAVPTSMTM